MKTIKPISFMLFALYSLFQSATLYAAPHVHGEAELTIAMEAKLLQIQLIAPASDIVGFEHQATSPEQQQTLSDARDVLSEFTNVFVFTDGECEVTKIDIDTSTLEKTKHDAHEHDKKHKHKHAHSNITATYDFKCEGLQALSTLNINVFDIFPAVSRVNTMWISEHVQGSQALSANNRQIRFE